MFPHGGASQENPHPAITTITMSFVSRKLRTGIARLRLSARREGVVSMRSTFSSVLSYSNALKTICRMKLSMPKQIFIDYNIAKYEMLSNRDSKISYEQVAKTKIYGCMINPLGDNNV